MASERREPEAEGSCHRPKGRLPGAPGTSGRTNGKFLPKCFCTSTASLRRSVLSLTSCLGTAVPERCSAFMFQWVSTDHPFVVLKQMTHGPEQKVIKTWELGTKVFSNILRNLKLFKVVYFPCKCGSFGGIICSHDELYAFSIFTIGKSYFLESGCVSTYLFNKPTWDLTFKVTFLSIYLYVV